MAKGAKKQLDPVVEARVVELLAALKHARDITEYCRALVAIGAGGEAGAEAQWRLKPPFRSFGGPPPGEDDGAVSWSPTHFLVVEEDLAGARLVARREVAPESVARPRPQNDEGGGQVSDEQADNDGPVASPESPPGADPDAVVAALREAFVAAQVKVGRVTAERRPGGGGRVAIQPAEGPKKFFDLGSDNWAESPAAIARGIVQAMGGED